MSPTSPTGSTNSISQQNKGPTGSQSSQQNKGPTGSSADLSLASSYFGTNNIPTLTDKESYSYKTRKEFEALYLGGLEKDEKKVMIKLFRFIFSNEPVPTLDSDSTFILKQLPAFYKVPCKADGHQLTLWKLFKKCIHYRIYGSDGKGLADGKGLNAELGSLQKILPHENQEYKDKQYLRAQLLRLLSIMDENGTCITFSDKGGVMSLSKYHSAILELIRKTVKQLITEKLPTEDTKTKALDALLNEIKNLKELDVDPNAIYDDMLGVVSAMFDTFTRTDKSIDVLEEKLKALSALTPQKGGAVDDEEYERVYSTAMEHLSRLNKNILETVHEILNTSGDLEDAIEQAAYRKGFSLSSAVKRFETIEGARAKSFLRCVQTLIEIKQEQLNTFDAPTLPPGEDRYLQTIESYPTLKTYTEPLLHLTKAEFAADKKAAEKTLRRMYPYTDALMEDIDIIREKDPCCLFYKAMLLKVPKNARKLCKKAAAIPRCKEIVEEVLEKVSLQQEIMHVIPIDIPKGFWPIADIIRNLKVDGLPITIHKPIFEEVLGEKPFILVGNGTLIIVNGREIDVTEEIDEIRREEISLGSLMFLYLYIKCDKHIDA